MWVMGRRWYRPLFAWKIFDMLMGLEMESVVYGRALGNVAKMQDYVEGKDLFATASMTWKRNSTRLCQHED